MNIWVDKITRLSSDEECVWNVAKRSALSFIWPKYIRLIVYGIAVGSHLLPFILTYLEENRVLRRSWARSSFGIHSTHFYIFLNKNLICNRKWIVRNKNRIQKYTSMQLVLKYKGNYEHFFKCVLTLGYLCLLGCTPTERAKVLTMSG